MKTITFDESAWVLVPVEPTLEMVAEGAESIEVDRKGHRHVSSRTARNCYVAMLAAAPTVKQSLSAAERSISCTKPDCFPYCDCGGVDDPAPTAKAEQVQCDECGGNGAGGDQEDDCSKAPSLPAELPEPDFALDGGSLQCYYAETVQRIDEQRLAEIAQLRADLDECDGERWKLRTKVQQLEAFSSQAAGSAVEEPAAWETRCNTERRFSVNQCSAEERAEHWRKNGRGIVEVAPLYYAALSTQQSAPERVSVPRDALQWPLEVGVDAQQKAADVGCDREDCLHDALQAMLAEIASHGRGEA